MEINENSFRGDFHRWLSFDILRGAEKTIGARSSDSQEHYWHNLLHELLLKCGADFKTLPKNEDSHDELDGNRRFIYKLQVYTSNYVMDIEEENNNLPNCLSYLFDTRTCSLFVFKYSSVSRRYASLQGNTN